MIADTLTLAIDTLIEKQRRFFISQKTKSVDFRIEQLAKLEQLIRANEQRMYTAIEADFGKSGYETYLTELSFLYHEIRFFKRKLKRLVKPKRIMTNLSNLPGKSMICHEPYGVCLVIGVWNYPFQLAFLPSISAIAAGNTVILKPSEVAPNTSTLMAELVSQYFDPSFFGVIEGGAEVTQALLNRRFDFIFYTGSTSVGKIVYQAAAKYLTPVVLELGGKNPTFVTESADISIAAKRIVWGKFLNGGQTCIAPDFILVHNTVKEAFIEAVTYWIKAFDYKAENQNFTRIINEKHFDRLLGLIEPDKVVVGGSSDLATRTIEPTIMYPVSKDAKVMEEEIFGPVLPILVYSDFDTELAWLNKLEKPLAAYLFSNDSRQQQQFLQQLSFGGGCINDTVMQFSNPGLPFGGVGSSGLGGYHGRHGFYTFSHAKSVMKKPNRLEPPVKYPPYKSWKFSLIKWLMEKF